MDIQTDPDADEQNDVLTEKKKSTPELVGSVLSQVQTEFAVWNVAHCQQVLTSLVASSNWRSCLHPDLRSPNLISMKTTSSSPFHALPVVSDTNFSSPLVVQEVYSPDRTVMEISSFKLEVIQLPSSLEPHPPYESSSPLLRSLFKGDDSDNMGFIPYADDPSFDQISHTHHYGSFSWQDTFDPDSEVIVLETLYRLQSRYTLTYDEIENYNILPLNLRSQLGISGVLSAARRRDRLHWAGNTIPTSYTFLPSTRPAISDFRSRINSLNSLFCPNLSCVEPLCSVHVEFNPMAFKSQSRVLKAREVTTPCRNQCFIDKIDEIEEVCPSWDEADINLFKVISDMSTNATPCDLAEICLKPCYEAFYYNKLLYSHSSDETRLANTKGQRRVPRFNDDNPMLFTPNEPCYHAGPCSSSSSCPCFKNRSHCQRNCHCALDCNRRWKGCRCTKGKSRWSCATERCPCFEALRECDPELCLNCRCVTDDTSCRNSQIQRGVRKELEVKRSSWGLGAFLVEAASAGDLIIEYVGELIYEPTVESRADLAIHRDRCYVFGLNNMFSLDSTYAGNLSRFIDHAGPEQRRVNSQARVRLVNGDHRIGIYAIQDLEAGSEVLMNYGSMFFMKQNCE